MKQDTIVIVYLSLSLLVLQVLLTRSLQRTAYLEGRQAVYDSFTQVQGSDNCYARDGNCEDNPNGEHISRK